MLLVVISIIVSIRLNAQNNMYIIAQVQDIIFLTDILDWLFSSIVMHQNKLAARLNHLLQCCLPFASDVLLSHLDLLLGYPTVDLWVLQCTPRKRGQVLSAQYYRNWVKS